MSISSTTEQVLMALRRLMRSVDLHSRALSQQCGLTGPQAMVLRHLAHAGPLTVGALAERVSLGQATVSGILDRLAQRDLIKRTRDATDKRRVQVHATAAGREIAHNAPPLLQEHFIDQFQGLKDWEQHQILTALQRLVAMTEPPALSIAPLMPEQPFQSGMNESTQNQTVTAI